MDAAQLPQAPGYPLKGVTVIDLGQIYNGPYCTFMMAMAGATVIKIEAMGGELDVIARFPDGSVKINNFADLGATSPL